MERVEKLCHARGNVGNDPVCKNAAFQSFNPASGTNNSQDNLFFTNIPAGGATIVYSLTSPAVSIGATQRSGDGGISNPPPVADQTFSVAVGGSTTVTTNVPAGNSTFNTQISLNNLTGQGQPDFRFLTYSVKCTPVSQPAKLKIAKKSVGGTGKFDFSSSGPTAIGNFSLTTVTENTAVTSSQFSNLASGAYTFTETLPSSDWLLTDVTCTGTGATVGTVSSSGQAQITLAQGADATCTFTNKRKGNVTIVKNTVGGDGTFAFTGSLVTADAAFGSLTTSGGTKTVTKTLAPGSYTITESAHSDFTFTSLNCSEQGGTNTTSTTKSGSTATINLDPGESVTCTYTNTKKANLTVKKATIGGDGKFDFSVTGPSTNETFQLMNGQQKLLSKVPAGQFTITETNLPAGWILQGVSCGSKNGNSTTVDLPAGGSVTCTFTNFKEKDDRMEDVTKLFIHRRVDNLLTHGPDRARMLRRLEGPPQEASIKDGPLKLQDGPSQLGMGGGATGTAGSGLSVAATGLGVTGFNLGSPISRAEGPYVGPNGTGMVGAGRSDDPDSMFDQPLQTSRMSGFGAAAFNQIGNVANGGLSQGFKFSASLSELRATLQAMEEAKAEEKARAAQELGFGGQPYTRPSTNMRQGFDFWVEGQLSRYDDGTGGINREGEFKILYVGADYTLTSRVLVGTLVQFDLTNEKVKNPDLTGSVDGRGWMAGPYIGIKLTDNIMFDARAAWGNSSNDIMLDDPLAGKRTGSFDTTRWLATATLTGNWFYGPWRFTPQVGIAYGHEEYDTYKNSLGQTVDGAGISIGRATFGTEVGYRIIASDGTLVEPHVGITGIWNFDSDDLVINGAVVETNKSRAKVDAGILLRRPNGMGMRAAVSYDGIGQSNYEAWTGQLWLNFPLN